MSAEIIIDLALVLRRIIIVFSVILGSKKSKLGSLEQAHRSYLLTDCHKDTSLKPQTNFRIFILQISNKCACSSFIRSMEAFKHVNEGLRETLVLYRLQHFPLSIKKQADDDNSLVTVSVSVEDNFAVKRRKMGL